MGETRMSQADAQLLAAQHAGEAAWIIIQRMVTPPQPSDYIRTYEHVYDKIFDLLSWAETDD